MTPSTERSIDPMRITRVAPTAMIRGIADWLRIVWMFFAVRNVPGFRIANTTTSTTNAPSSPTLLKSTRRRLANPGAAGRAGASAGVVPAEAPALVGLTTASSPDPGRPAGTGCVLNGPFAISVSTQPGMSWSYLVYWSSVCGVTQLSLKRLSRCSCGSFETSMAPVAAW